jgi:predicted RNase H-like HicB family nuclease
MALRYKLPSSLTVSIHKDPSGIYTAKVFDENEKYPYVTQGETGQELIEMVNDLIFTMRDIPDNYRPYLGGFFPTQDILEELKVHIPAKYLDKNFALARI